MFAHNKYIEEIILPKSNSETNSLFNFFLLHDIFAGSRINGDNLSQYLVCGANEIEFLASRTISGEDIERIKYDCKVQETKAKICHHPGWSFLITLSH